MIFNKTQENLTSKQRFYYGLAKTKNKKGYLKQKNFRVYKFFIEIAPYTVCKNKKGYLKHEIYYLHQIQK